MARTHGSGDGWWATPCFPSGRRLLQLLTRSGMRSASVPGPGTGAQPGDTPSRTPFPSPTPARVSAGRAVLKPRRSRFEEVRQQRLDSGDHVARLFGTKRFDLFDEAGQQRSDRVGLRLQAL